MGERLNGKDNNGFLPLARWADLVQQAGGNAPSHEFVVSWLRHTLPRNQRRNDTWAEGCFDNLREERGDWSCDQMWVDENSKIVGSTVLSTYRAFSNNASLNFAYIGNLAKSIIRRESLVFPMLPKFETVLFWKASDERKVMPVVEEVTGSFSRDEYESRLSGDFQMVRLRRDKLGRKGFAEHGVTLGNIGFLDSIKLADGRYGLGGFIPRIRFRQTNLLPDGAYISSIDPEEIRRDGGIPIEESHPNVPVLQISKRDEEVDFIAATLLAGRVRRNLPVVLSYTTYRLWLGESPRHDAGS